MSFVPLQLFSSAILFITATMACQALIMFNQIDPRFTKGRGKMLGQFYRKVCGFY